jgi:hypothetical protein
MRYAIFVKSGMVRKWMLVGVRGTVNDALIMAKICLSRNIGKSAYVDVRIEKQEQDDDRLEYVQSGVAEQSK